MVDIIRSLLQKQQYRQAAQVIERMSNRLTNNPDVMVTLWNDQQMSVYQVQIPYLVYLEFVP